MNVIRLRYVIVPLRNVPVNEVAPRHSADIARFVLVNVKPHFGTSSVGFRAKNDVGTSRKLPRCAGMYGAGHERRKTQTAGAEKPAVVVRVVRPLCGARSVPCAVKAVRTRALLGPKQLAAEGEQAEEDECTECQQEQNGQDEASDASGDWQD
jgi:hypothetical protein